MRNSAIGLVLCLAAAPALAQMPVTNVLLAEQVPFSNQDLIDRSIIAECNLPARHMELLQQSLGANGIQYLSAKDPDPKSGGTVLKLEIASASSSGNAFMGHFKTVTVTGKLFQKGEETGSFVATRKSSGGAFAGFKGSCAVLGRCVKAISDDVARWLASPSKGARLGDSR